MPACLLVVINWIMKTSTSECRNGIQWTLWSQLDDLDIPDDLPLLSHSQQQMQKKTNALAAILAHGGLIINKEKTKILKINSNSNNPSILNGSPLEEVHCFPYLGSIINQRGGTDADVKARTGKIRVTFIHIKNILAFNVKSNPQTNKPRHSSIAVSKGTPTFVGQTPSATSTYGKEPVDCQ